MLSKLYKLADEDRAVLPCYLVSDVIFSHCVQEKTFILLIVHQKKLKRSLYFLLLGKEKNGLSLISHKNYLTQQCLVVSGEMVENGGPDTSYHSIIRRIFKKNPLRLILANTAAHPQYAGTKLQTFRDNPFLLLSPEDKGNHEKNLFEMQRFALHEGCSKINPTVFYLKHIYASQVGREVTRLHKNSQICIEAYSVLGEREYENDEEIHF